MSVCAKYHNTLSLISPRGAVQKPATDSATPEKSNARAERV